MRELHAISGIASWEPSLLLDGRPVEVGVLPGDETVRNRDHIDAIAGNSPCRPTVALI